MLEKRVPFTDIFHPPHHNPPPPRYKQTHFFSNQQHHLLTLSFKHFRRPHFLITSNFVSNNFKTIFPQPSEMFLNSLPLINQILGNIASWLVQREFIDAGQQLGSSTLFFNMTLSSSLRISFSRSSDRNRWSRSSSSLCRCSKWTWASNTPLFSKSWKKKKKKKKKKNKSNKSNKEK